MPWIWLATEANTRLIVIWKHNCRLECINDECLLWKPNLIYTHEYARSRRFSVINTFTYNIGFFAMTSRESCWTKRWFEKIMWCDFRQPHCFKVVEWCKCGLIFKWRIVYIHYVNKHSIFRGVSIPLHIDYSLPHPMLISFSGWNVYLVRCVNGILTDLNTI